MKSFFRSFLASLLALTVLICIVAGVAYMKLNEMPGIEDDSWLVIDIYGSVSEYAPPADLLGQVTGGGGENLHRILTNLEKARVDDRIAGVIFKLSSSTDVGRAGMEEIRNEIARVQAAGKRVYGFADSFEREIYYMATACDSLYAPNSAYIYFTGFGHERMYVKGALEKLGIEANLHKIKDYKSAAEMIIRSDMSDETRENVNWMIDDYWTATIEAMASGRNMTEEQVIALMEHALFTAPDAVEAGLIDRLLYWDELEDMLKGEDDTRLKTVCQSRYAMEEAEDLGLGGDETIAVIHAHGNIGGRQSRIDPLMGTMMGHETVIADLRRAREDEDVAAIVFRIDSGGGESLASDLIGHEIEVCASVKPTVVSMVNVAASGGYSIAYRATKLVADKLTVTGSIGSISGKFNMKGLYDKLGITFDNETRGPNGLFMSDKRNFTEAEWERFTEDHWQGFNSWLRDVAEHRGMSFEDAEKLAHGRIWTGTQALDNGLIDEVGDLVRAVEVAKELAEIPAEEQVTLVHYPEETDFLDTLFGGGEGDVSALLRNAIYGQMRADVAESWRLVNETQFNRVER